MPSSLHVLLGNERARGLYERFGFRAVSLEPPKCRMRLSLEAG